MTPAQKNIVADILKGDLKTASHQRLIELCLLYEAAPDAHDTFPAALKTELERRFTAAEIGKNDVLFAVLQKKANGYQSAIPLFHQRLLEMAGTVNRDIWFTDNKALFESAIADADVAKWLVKQHDILEKCLHNRLALAMLAASATASSAILSDQTAVALWKNAPALWDIWPQHAPGMAVIAKSSELTQYIVDTAPAFSALMASKTAWEALATGAEGMRVIAASAKAIAAVAASQTAMAAVAASQTAMAAVAASQTAMAAVAASQTAMAAVAAAATALAAIVRGDSARAALIAANNTFQSVKEVMYRTISRSGSGWSQRHSQAEDGVTQLDANFANPAGLIFACLGYYGSNTSARSNLIHPGGTQAASAGSSSNPTTMASVDGVSFNGATFTEENDGYAYAELWSPA